VFAFITLGTNNLTKSSKFYDSILKPFGIIKSLTTKRYIGYSKKNNLNKINFYLMIPFNEEEATNGNGVMISFDAKTINNVNEFHQIGITNGGTNEGFPGPRHGEDYYAYIRDIDGNKICAYSKVSQNKI
jgi:predicted lactoylglutathione lyase